MHVAYWMLPIDIAMFQNHLAAVAIGTRLSRPLTAVTCNARAHSPYMLSPTAMPMVTTPACPFFVCLLTAEFSLHSLRSMAELHCTPPASILCSLQYGTVDLYGTIQDPPGPNRAKQAQRQCNRHHAASLPLSLFLFAFD